MAGNARFELASGSPEPGHAGNYPNGQRGNYLGPTLDRSGSFREGGESRVLGSGISTARASGTVIGDLPPLSQSLMLEPIIMGDQKYTRSGELRRVLGISIGNASEDNSFGPTHPKPSPPVAMDEIRRYRGSVVDGCLKARGRAKKLNQHLHKLNKFCEDVTSKKQHRNDLSTNERSSGSSLKMGIQISRNPSDLVTQRLGDRAKNVGLNKRVRTSVAVAVAETRAEWSSNGLPRQSQVMAKDRDTPKVSGVGSDLVEENIRRLPAGEEGWDRNMKRKRSIGTTFTRPVDSDKELKRAMHHKLSNETGLQSCNPHGFRPGSSNGAGGINKLETSSTSADSIAHATPKNELEKSALPRDLKAGKPGMNRLLAKGSTKFNIREENDVFGTSLVTKGKASRVPRTGSVMGNSSSHIPRVSVALEGSEQPRSANKIHSVGGANDRKRPIASESSLPPMAQWGGQKPQKISRTRRANLVSPVSNHDDSQMPSEGCSPSDFGSRINSGGAHGSPLSRRVVNNGTQQLKVKIENVSSPARLSESEELSAAENGLNKKGFVGIEVGEKAVNGVPNVESSVMLTNKKLPIKEETGDGVRRQGRSGRGSAFSRASISNIREKLESAIPTKPLRSTRPVSDKSVSKSGRPLKKLSERKGFSRLGPVPNSNSPDFTGESDDDREELLAAANFACNASYLSCSSLYWKKMEPIFTSVSLEDASYLSKQLKSAEELHANLSQMFNHGDNILVDPLHGGNFVSGAVELVDQFQGVDTLCERLDSEKIFNKITPLYQRVLSALIADDEIEDDSCLPIDIEPRKRDSMAFECKAMYGVQTPNQFTANRYLSCNGSLNSKISPSIQNFQCNDGMLLGDGGYLHSEVGVFDGIFRNVGSNVVQPNGFGVSSFEYPYEQMCLNDKLLLELQSIGLYPETVPDLDDREDEVINQEIVQLEKGLYHQIGKKTVCLEKMQKAIQGGWVEERYLELVAMNRLVELAYRKLLATRASSASRSGVPKVSKQVALAFVKRTLARCRKFEDSGTSCFIEPSLRDIIFSTPPRGNEAEALTFTSPTVAKNKYLESQSPQPKPRASGSFSGDAEWPDIRSKIYKGSFDGFDSFNHQTDQAFAKNGPMSNRGKKKEVLLDDVGGSTALRASSTLGSTLLGGTKGKRSERERDKDMSTRNVVAKAGRPSVGIFKGEQSTKSKPKQKTVQLPTSGNGSISNFTGKTHLVYPSACGSDELVTTTSNRKREVGLMPPGNSPQDSSKESQEPMDLKNMQLHELGSIEELDVGTDLGGPQDLSSWLNFEEDGLQDHDSLGLEIPMDDLSELNMF